MSPVKSPVVEPELEAAETAAGAALLTTAGGTYTEVGVTGAGVGVGAT